MEVGPERVLLLRPEQVRATLVHQPQVVVIGLAHLFVAQPPAREVLPEWPRTLEGECPAADRAMDLAGLPRQALEPSDDRPPAAEPSRDPQDRVPAMQQSAQGLVLAILGKGGDLDGQEKMLAQTFEARRVQLSEPGERVGRAARLDRDEPRRIVRVQLVETDPVMAFNIDFEVVGDPVLPEDRVEPAALHLDRVDR